MEPWAWWVSLIFYSLICGLGGGIITSSKNRGWGQGVCLGFFLGLIGLIVTVGVAPLKPPPAKPQKSVLSPEWQAESQPMGFPATLSAVTVGILGGIAVVAGVIAFANWLA
ncbi:hypothetical protein [Mycolicibacter heraklionensis]|uniref:hypothetical protein n=1 Tax=Mycolicibacter heraklionensis TaxID=512402 RepID=UPI000B1D2FAD|nr:hypothetical protein [Mycolicibacter heraklionensis]